MRTVPHTVYKHFGFDGRCRGIRCGMTVHLTNLDFHYGEALCELRQQLLRHLTEQGDPMPIANLRPMSEAPTSGPVVEILVATTDRAGCNGWLIAHYANGGGEEQPRFRGWFFWTGYEFQQIKTEKLLGWLPLPSLLNGRAVAPTAG